MIPIRDANPSLARPLITWLFIAAAVYVYFAVQPQSTDEAERFAYEFATIPCEVTTGDPLDQVEITEERCLEESLGDAPFSDKSIPFSLLASIFLHGGLGHLLGNMWFLWIFGNNVEDGFGRLGYAVFYLLAGVVASLSYVALQPEGTIPLVGASGAISAVMGAYLVLYPTARIVSIFPLFFFMPIAIPAVVFLVLWFLGQFALAGGTTNIAWEAHVAGFLFGVVVAAALRTTVLRRVFARRRARAALPPIRPRQPFL